MIRRWGRRRCAVVLAVCLFGATLTGATITDDISPLGKSVHVTLRNADGAGKAGAVEILADHGDGVVATQVVPFEVGPRNTAIVTATFASKVKIVLDVTVINDEPDPR